MTSHVNYWRNPSGKAPVEKYIDEINNKEERAEVLSALKGIPLTHSLTEMMVGFRFPVVVNNRFMTP